MYMYEEKDVQEVHGGTVEGGGGGGEYRKNVHPSWLKMQSPCNTTCRYRGCMKKTILTMHDLPAHRSRLQQPVFPQLDSDAFHFQWLTYSACCEETYGTWQNSAVCYKHSLNALMLCPESRVEVRFTQPTGPTPAKTGHSSDANYS